MKTNNRKFNKVKKTFMLTALTLCSASLLAGCSSSTPGPKGETGSSGNLWYVQNYAPNTATQGKTGDMFLDSSTYNLYRKADYGWVFVGNIKGSDGENGEEGERGWKGENGDEIELKITETHIQWKYKQSSSWQNLISLDSLKGNQGETGQKAREVEFQKTETHIQWRYIALNGENQEDFSWQNLVELSAIQGTIGKDGKSAYEIALENDFEGSEVEWLNSLKGTNGATWHVENVNPTDQHEAQVGDLFLNISTYDIFKLTASGWENIGNIKATSPTIEINNKGYWVIDGIPTEVLADQTKGDAIADVKAYNYLETSYFADKKITILGDSVTVGVGASDKNSTSYASLIASKLGATIENLGINGTTFCDQLIDENKVSANCRYSDVKNYSKETDYFIIQLGVNDWSRSEHSNLQLGTLGSNNLNTFYGAVNVYAKTLVQKFEGKNTKIIFLTPTICKNVVGFDTKATNKLGYSLRDMCNAIIETANLYDIQVLDLNLESGIYYKSSSDNNTSEYLTDGLHPNDAGHELIANKIIEFLQSNYQYTSTTKSSMVNLSFYVDALSSMRNNRNYVVTGGKYLVPNVPKEKSGYTFKYWQDKSNNLYNPGDIITVNANMVLEAQYAKNLDVTIHNIVGNETSTIQSSIAFSGEIDDETNSLISQPISSLNLTESYGLVPTFYSDASLSNELSLDSTFLETETPEFYVYWETDPNWFVVSDGVLTGKTELFPVNYSSDKEVEKLIFPRKDSNGNLITSIDSSAFFLNQSYSTGSGTSATIGSDVFKKTTEIFFPEGYTSISGAFFLTARGSNSTDTHTPVTISIPKTLTSITDQAFGNLNINKFNIDDNNTAYSDLNGMWFNKTENKLLKYTNQYSQVEPLTILTSYVMPETITSLGTFAFYGNKILEEITLSSKFNSAAGANTFAYMNKLTKITITKNISSDGTTGNSNITPDSLGQMSEFVKNGSIYVIDEDDKTYLSNLLTTKYSTLASKVYVTASEE